MIAFVEMQCRGCGVRITPTVRSVAKPKRVSSHSDCYYICSRPDCRCGYSNARKESNRRLIFPEPSLNIPPEVRSGLDDVLRESLNLTNRSSKRSRFAFETSEDAVTWTVFRYLFDSQNVSKAIAVPDSFEAL